MTDKNNFDENSIYGKFEMDYLIKTQKDKAKWLMPLLKLFTKIHIHANHISFLSALVVVASFSFSIYYNQQIIFIFGIWIHMLLDGIDGALARYQKTSSFKGSIIDVFSDQFGITFACIFVYYFNIVNTLNISIFFVLYTAVLLFSFYLLYRKTRFEIVIRPRIFLYYAFTIDVLIFIRFTEIIVLIANIFLFVSIILGIYQLKLLKKKPPRY